MTSKWRRYEVLLPLQFNDGRELQKNRRWMKLYRDRWKARLQQIELWLVRYTIDVE